MNDDRITSRATAQGCWGVRRSRRKGWSYEVINGFRDTIAVVYGDKAEAELLASAPEQRTAAQELRVCTKRLAAILGQFQERLMPSELDALNRARELASR